MALDFNLSLLLPEITMVAFLALLAALEMFLPAVSRRYALPLNLIGTLLVGIALIGVAPLQGVTFQGAFSLDAFSLFFKFLFLATAVVVLLMTRENPPAGPSGAEFYLILWSALLGMFFLVSAKDFLLLFISLELLTLSVYILAAYTRHELASVEAGLKYLILGSLASAFLLYGISLIYASTGTLSFERLTKVGADLVSARSGQSQGLPLPFLVGVLLVISALGFKVAMVPFHLWVPDVYQGAPTPVVAFLSVASKSAGFAALLRLLFEALPFLGEERRILFSLFAAMTLLYGNLGALVQNNMKRLLGYSSIGHAGYLLIAVAAEPALGGKALLYYLIAYAVTNLTAFFIVSRIDNPSLEAYRGLSRRSPLLGAALFLAFLSLAGVPPLGGFFAKFLVLLAAAQSKLFWLVFLGAVNVAISLYYYLNVIRIAYFEKPQEETALSVSLPSTLLLYVLMAGIILVGVWQLPFFQIASQAAASLL